jgi:hypothetical protein
MTRLDPSTATNDGQRLAMEMANLCAAAFEAGGWGRTSHLRTLMIEPALLTSDAKAGVLHLAIELRNTLMRSSDGRQALRDLGLEPILEHVERE